VVSGGDNETDNKENFCPCVTSLREKETAVLQERNVKEEEGKGGRQTENEREKETREEARGDCSLRKKHNILFIYYLFMLKKEEKCLRHSLYTPSFFVSCVRRVFPFFILLGAYLISLSPFASSTRFHPNFSLFIFAFFRHCDVYTQKRGEETF
jgi:hypothetical protein